MNFAEQIGIYALYDDQFRLVYVGQAGSGRRGLYRRLRSHTLNVLSERWSRFSWFGLVPAEELNSRVTKRQDIQLEIDKPIQLDKLTILNQIEAALIAASEPLRNKQSGRFGRAVTHYRQYKGNFEPDEDSDVSDPDDSELV